jgi:polysaccharide biosynthesis transport protein
MIPRSDTENSAWSTSLAPVRPGQPQPYLLVPQAVAGQTLASPAADDDSDSQFSLSSYFWIIRRNWKWIAAFTVVATLIAFLVTNRVQKLYEATAVVDIDRMSPSAVLGEETRRQSLNDSDQFISTQMKLMQSDSVLRPVAEKFNLWESEGQIDKSNAAAAARIRREPVRLKRLTVRRPPNTYLVQISYRSHNPELAAEVANEVVKAYMGHNYKLRIGAASNLSQFMEREMEELKAKMERSGQALATFERELNVINPEEKGNIVSARLLQLNEELTRVQSDRMRKEASWRAVNSGSPEAAQVSGQGEALSRLRERLDEAKQKQAELQTTFGSRHPENRKANSQVTELQRQFDELKSSIGQRVEVDYRQTLDREKMVQRALAETKGEFDRLNEHSFEYQQLKREAENDKKLYDEIVRRIREAGINAGFQNDNIRFADLARPSSRPVYPNLPLSVTAAAVLSLLVSIGTAILIDLIDTRVREPEHITRLLKTEVIGTLPAFASREQALLASSAVGGDGRSAGLIKVQEHDEKGLYRSLSTYSEAIRSLRNTILLSDVDRRIRTMLLTSAMPGEGKTQTAVQLAVAHAEQRNKTLIIDCDMRRPAVHRRLNCASEPGLSDVLTLKMNWRKAVIPVPGYPDLFVLPAGPPSHKAADLVGPGMSEMLDEMKHEFDLVVVDGPPSLGFAEPLQLGAVTDSVVVVARAGSTRREVLGNVLSRLRKVRANVMGVVLNGVDAATSASYYHHGYYQKNYYYRADKKAS